MQYKSLFMRPRTFLVVMVFFSLASFIVFSSSSGTISGDQGSSEKVEASSSTDRKQNSEEDLIQLNRTKGLVIASIDKGSNYIRVSLRNDYRKTITGYKVSTGDGSIYTECLTGDENVPFAPGTARQALYPINTRRLEILAVIFDDGTTDGDPQYIREIKEYRLGRKMQRQRAIRLLKRILDMPPGQVEGELANLESELSPVSVEEVEKLPPRVRFGIRDEKLRVLEWVRHLQDIHAKNALSAQGDRKAADNMGFRETLTNLIDQYKGSVNKL